MATKTTAEAVVAAGDPGSTSPLPDEELLGLRRLLLRAEGFALAFVRSNVPTESRRIVGELEASLAAEGVKVRELWLSETVEDLYGGIVALEPPLEADQALVVIGSEQAIPSGADFPAALERLNLRRERFRELPCPLVLVLPDYALDLLASKAPDLWAWRSGVFETRPIAKRLDQTVLDGSLPAFIGLGTLSIERKKAHLEVLKSALADLEGEGPATETDRSELNLRIAVILQSIGEPSEALAHAQAALDHAGVDLRGRASALGQIADILQARGDLDEAMRIRQEDQLPVYEKLGDVRSRAVTLGKIADILQARGDLDEAMRIRQEDQLPVYEKLGDVRSRAVTLGKIADILQARGDLDEAMRIYQEEGLPVYERIGDVRSRIVTLQHIASIHLSRDREGGLERARELLLEALFDAERLRIPEADQIKRLLKAHALEPDPPA